MKVCNTCKDEKPFDEFYLSSDKKRYRNDCKTCFKLKRKPENSFKLLIRWIFCPRGEGGYILKKDCLPGCNDACKTCEHFSEDQTINNYEVQVENGTQSSAGYTVDMAPNCY